MIGRIWASVWLLSVLILFSPVSRAEGERTEIWFTPRLWYSFINKADDSFSFATGEWVGQATTTATQPTYGATLTIKPAQFAGTSLNLTGYFGKGEGRFSQYQQNNSGWSGYQTSERLELDATLQMPISTHGAYWSTGFRYRRGESTTDGSNAFGNTIHTDRKNENYLGELGLGTSAALNDEGTQRLFGGLAGLAGASSGYQLMTSSNGFRNFSPTSSSFMTGIDANFGYAISLSSWGVLSARYRVQTFMPLTSAGQKIGTDIQHGPEVNFSLKLN